MTVTVAAPDTRPFTVSGGQIVVQVVKMKLIVPHCPCQRLSAGAVW